MSTRLDIPPDRILEHNIGSLKNVILFGYDHSDRFIICSSHSNAADVLLSLERFKKRLLEDVEDADI